MALKSSPGRKPHSEHHHGNVSMAVHTRCPVVTFGEVLLEVFHRVEAGDSQTPKFTPGGCSFE